MYVHTTTAAHSKSENLQRLFSQNEQVQDRRSTGDLAATELHEHLSKGDFIAGYVTCTPTFFSWKRKLQTCQG